MLVHNCAHSVEPVAVTISELAEELELEGTLA